MTVLTSRRRAGAAGSALALAAGLLVPGLVAPTPASAAPTQIQTDPIALEKGHVDAFHTVLNDDETVTLALSDDATGDHVKRTPESTDLVVKAEAQTTFRPTSLVPDELKGRTVYRLPLNQNPNLVWPGWDTNELRSVYGNQASTDFVLECTSCAGEVYLWTQNADGDPQSLLASGDFRIDPADTIRQAFPAHAHASWAFTEPGAYEFSARAEVSGNGKSTTSNTVNYTFVVAPELAITGLSHHYHQGRPITLNATSTPEVQGGGYEWYVQRTDQAAPVRVEGANGPQLSLTSEQALDGAQVTAKLVGSVGSEAASAPAVTIDVDDHGAAPSQKVTVAGAKDHYHSGDSAALTASVDPASVLSRYEWLVQRTGESDWTAVAGRNGAEYAFPVTAALDGAKVKAKLTYDDGRDYVESEPVEIHVDDHHEPAPLPFTDVQQSNKFYDEIAWMYREGLTTGTKQPDGTVKYLPKDGVSREAMAAFLYRLADKPAFTVPKKSPFTDVKPTDKFYKEITWLASKGITTGTKQPNGTLKFQPKSKISREAMAAFMYRFEGKPNYSAPSVSAFKDVQKGQKFFKEIHWMKSEGITTGTKQPSGKPKYEPKKSVTREAMAAFVYRLEN